MSKISKARAKTKPEKAAKHLAGGGEYRVVLGPGVYENIRDALPGAQRALIEALSQWEGESYPLSRLASFLELCDSELSKGKLQPVSKRARKA